MLVESEARQERRKRRERNIYLSPKPLQPHNISDIASQMLPRFRDPPRDQGKLRTSSPNESALSKGMELRWERGEECPFSLFPRQAGRGMSRTRLILNDDQTVQGPVITSSNYKAYTHVHSHAWECMPRCHSLRSAAEPETPFFRKTHPSTTTNILPVVWGEGSPLML